MKFWSLSCLLKSGGSLLTLLLFSQAGAAALGAHGEITGFNLNSCGTKNCLVIKSSKAFTGIMPSIYAFDSASITITDKKTKSFTTIHSDDAFFDFVSSKLFIRKITEYKNAEAIYDLRTEKLSIYFLGPRS